MTLTRRSGLFAGFVACVSLANLPLLRDLIAHSSRNETASHVMLIPFVVIVLVWWDRQRIFAAPAFAAGLGIGVLWPAWPSLPRSGSSGCRSKMGRL